MIDLNLQLFGGRGARFGRSDYKEPHDYGTQYETLLEYENIKFVKNKVKGAEPLMETMTEGRVYVQIGGDEPIRIVFFDDELKRNKVIEKDKNTGEWHVHLGYEHSEYSEKNHDNLSENDKKFLEKVLQIWHNRDR